MGLIRAAMGAVGGALADQWIDAIGVPGDLVKQDTLLIRGQALRQDGRSSNVKGTADVITNGSRIVVPTNTALLLVDGGQVVDVSTEPGYYTVDNAAQPSVFVGQWGDSVRQAWERFKFGGTTPQQQVALFITQREIRDIKFGTKQAIQYFDTFYNSELFLRTFGSFTILINNPVLFFANVYDKASPRVNFSDIHEQFLTEFMAKLTTAIAQLSGQGVRVSSVQQHQGLLSQVMSQLLDADWTQGRGIEILQVAVESISYTDESRELINLRNRGAMLSDPAIQRGYVAGTVADALHEAGANPEGGAGGMLGIGFAGGAAGGLFGGPIVPPAPGAPAVPPNQPPPGTPVAPVAPVAPAAAAPAAAGAQTASGPRFCPDCGTPTTGTKFCGNCGRQLY
ncbi:MAG: SPFH domain-containing protein [Bifidobacteriaceae bacterium]|jgi:membrane protease subunit (stomatin/prohibitin family)|nr:SPFH domain-containing protein [Bifidobacteriaceae bacterium]